jgi:hypothetical protein
VAVAGEAIGARAGNSVAVARSNIEGITVRVSSGVAETDRPLLATREGYLLRAIMNRNITLIHIGTARAMITPTTKVGE